MRISRELAIRILKYCDLHKSFYFPFWVVCREYSEEDEDFVEIEPSEWKNIRDDDKYQTFELWENLQNLDKETLILMSMGFIHKITNNLIEYHIALRARGYRKYWKEKLLSEKIEDYGLNEFMGGKAEGFEESLEIVKKFSI
jgi:hypothetical protein